MARCKDGCKPENYFPVYKSARQKYPTETGCMKCGYIVHNPKKEEK